jgi:transposase
MEKKSRRKFGAEFKAKVALEAIRERHTVEELARKYELHPTQINTWKREFLSKAAAVFSGPDPEAEAQKDADTEKLYAKIGQLEMENDWLKKKLK